MFLNAAKKIGTYYRWVCATDCQVGEANYQAGQTNC